MLSSFISILDFLFNPEHTVLTMLVVFTFLVFFVALIPDNQIVVIRSFSLLITMCFSKNKFMLYIVLDKIMVKLVITYIVYITESDVGLKVERTITIEYAIEYKGVVLKANDQTKTIQNDIPLIHLGSHALVNYYLNKENIYKLFGINVLGLAHNVGFANIPEFTNLIKRKAGVYALIDIHTGEIYIGSSNNMHRRILTHNSSQSIANLMTAYETRGSTTFVLACLYILGTTAEYDALKNDFKKSTYKVDPLLLWEELFMSMVPPHKLLNRNTEPTNIGAYSQSPEARKKIGLKTSEPNSGHFKPGLNHPKAQACCLTNIKTGEVLFFNSYTAAGKFLGITRVAVYAHALNGKPYVDFTITTLGSAHIFKPVDNTQLVITPKPVIVSKRNKPVTLTSVDGTSEFKFGSILELANTIRACRGTIRDCIKSGTPYFYNGAPYIIKLSS